MTRTITTTIITLVFAAAQLLVGSIARESHAVADEPAIAAIGADLEEVNQLDKAIALFDDSGLTLPDLEVVFFDDKTECGGHYGLFQEGFTPWRILICSDLPFVLPHELGHAWAGANLTDLDRDRYSRARGLTNWNDHDTSWEQRGTEDAAFILQQNLTASNVSMRSSTWSERAEAFFDDKTECGGHYGLFQEGFTPWRILICSDLPFVLPHELGHAWAGANLTDLDRDRYSRARGLTNWNDHDTSWEQRGTEDAAFILQQNLTASNVSMRSSTWSERAEAFELLTGRVSPLRTLVSGGV